MKEQINGETRKIQFTGKSTYIVSLPKKWVNSLGLKAGSPILITQQDSSLILTPQRNGQTCNSFCRSNSHNFKRR